MTMVFTTDNALSSLDEVAQVAAGDVSITDGAAQSASIGRSIAATDFDNALEQSLSDLDFQSINVEGAKQEKALKGNSKAGIFVGGDGDDTIIGNEGANLIIGGSGINRIFGGASNGTPGQTGDTIVLDPNGKMIIEDFERKDFIAINSDVIDPNNIQTTRRGDDTLIRDKSTGAVLAELIGFQGINDSQFSIVSDQKFKLDRFAEVHDLQIVEGDDGDDRLDVSGQAKDGFLIGNGGNDTLIG